MPIANPPAAGIKCSFDVPDRLKLATSEALVLESARSTSEAEAQHSEIRMPARRKAFANLAVQESVDLTTTIELLLNAPTKPRQSVAIAALTTAPNPRRLDRLWTIHQQRLDALDDKTDASRHMGRKSRTSKRLCRNRWNC